jgi:hypothetical protein
MKLEPNGWSHTRETGSTGPETVYTLRVLDVNRSGPALDLTHRIPIQILTAHGTRSSPNKSTSISTTARKQYSV